MNIFIQIEVLRENKCSYIDNIEVYAICDIIFTETTKNWAKMYSRTSS
jgi:hypothetical protein